LLSCARFFLAAAERPKKLLTQLRKNRTKNKMEMDSTLGAQIKRTPIPDFFIIFTQNKHA
jgi:hypothetical protein